MSSHIAEVVKVKSEYVVKFEFVAKKSDELSLHVGHIIKNCRQVEEGWMEGELNGKRGVFPNNFVAKKAIFPHPGVY